MKVAGARAIALEMFVEGARRTSETSEIVRSPIDDEIIAHVALADPAAVNAAAQAAARAFEERAHPAYERSRWLRASADRLRADAERFTAVLVDEVGKTEAGAKGEVGSAVQVLEWLSQEALRVSGETIRGDVAAASDGSWIVTRREPAGPVCAITAFNAPLNQAAHKMGASLAAGDPVVIKPSPLTPIATSMFVDVLLDSGVPSSWISLVYGGAEVGQALFECTEFARYTFTGSRRVGAELVRSIGLRPALLEMGSNAPNIVHWDADLERAVASIADGAFATAGQVCIRPQRVLVHERVYDEFAARFASSVSTLKLGDPRLPSTDVGPVRTDEAATRITTWIEDAERAGARVLTGGGHNGRYVEPTVLSKVPLDQAVVCEEVFGPVVVLQSYADLEEAIRMANDSPYGLQAGVFTQNLETFAKVVPRLRVGGVIVNDSSRLRLPHVPFGGTKESGLGREGGKWGVEALMDMKTVVIRPGKSN